MRIIPLGFAQFLPANLREKSAEKRWKYLFSYSHFESAAEVKGCAPAHPILYSAVARAPLITLGLRVTRVRIINSAASFN